MRRLTIMNVGYPLAAVGPDAVGGAEQVLSALDRAIVAAGHRSIVVAARGSTAAGELVTYEPATTANGIDEHVTSEQRARADAAIRDVLTRTLIDVVHMHGLDFHHYLPPPGRPVLATLHLPPDWYPARALAPDRPATWLNCVSAHQAAAAGPSRFMLPAITNGVRLTDLEEPSPRKRDYTLMLARVCPEKGQHLALQAAHASGTALVIGGEVFPYAAHREYFETQVRPLLDQTRRFVGPVGFARKQRLLAGASCLLIPSLAAETSSLVAMEAAGCGTPVVAFRVGALPEVVEHGRTGFVVDSVEEMAAAIHRVGDIDPATCRAVAKARFAVDAMTDAYLARYGELAG